MAAQCRKSKRMAPSRAVPCRVMSKSVDNEEHSYVPDTDKIPKFDGVSGCKITAKNKAMGDYRYIYPMLDPDGKTRLVTEHDFHHRMKHKYRALEGHSYVYPVLTLGIHEGKRSDLISAPESKDTFVPMEVDRMIPQGVDLILTDYDDRTLLYIASKRGDIYVADKRKIPYQGGDAADGDVPSVKSVTDVNKEGEPKPTKKQMRDIDRWKKQMEDLNRFGNNMSGNRMVYFGSEVNREEWRDDDIMSWFEENYPEDTEESLGDKLEENCDAEDGDDEEDETDDADDTAFEKGCAIKSSCASSVDEDDSGYADRRKSSYVSSRMSCESFTSDDPQTEIETGITPNEVYINKSHCSDPSQAEKETEILDNKVENDGSYSSDDPQTEGVGKLDDEGNNEFFNSADLQTEQETEALYNEVGINDSFTSDDPLTVTESGILGNTERETEVLQDNEVDNKASFTSNDLLTVAESANLDIKTLINEDIQMVYVDDINNIILVSSRDDDTEQNSLKGKASYDSGFNRVGRCSENEIVSVSPVSEPYFFEKDNLDLVTRISTEVEMTEKFENDNSSDMFNSAILYEKHCNPHSDFILDTVNNNSGLCSDDEKCPEKGYLETSELDLNHHGKNNTLGVSEEEICDNDYNFGDISQK